MFSPTASYTASTATTTASFSFYYSPTPPRPRVMTEKMLRDIAAAKAHHEFVHRAVRLPADPEPPAIEARHGYSQAPRFSAHTSTRTR